MPPVVFAITPAHAFRGLLDYSKAEHHKVYKSGIRPVSEDPFNCDAEGLFQFLREVEDRADKMGWSAGILNDAVNAEGEEEERKLCPELWNNHPRTSRDVRTAAYQWWREEEDRGHLYVVLVPHGVVDI